MKTPMQTKSHKQADKYTEEDIGTYIVSCYLSVFEALRMTKCIAAKNIGSMMSKMK